MSLGCPLVPMGRYDDGLVVNPVTGEVPRLTSQGWAGIAPGPFNKEGFLARGGPVVGGDWREGFTVRPFKAVFSQMLRQHIKLALMVSLLSQSLPCLRTQLSHGSNKTRKLAVFG